MNWEETVLAEKIAHARKTSSPGQAFAFSDIRELVELRNSKNTFLIYYPAEGDRIELSYADFYIHMLRTAAFLSKNGLLHGDRIATVSMNHWHTVVHYFAAWYLGLVVVPVNIGEDDDRIAYILQKGEVKLAFVREDQVDRFASILKNNALSGIQTVSCGSSVEAFASAVTDFPEKKNPREGNYFHDDALIVFTSGTTGNPKGVVLTQQNLLEDARAIADWHHIGTDTRMMCVLPIHHVNGTVVTLMTPFFTGGSVVLNQKFKVDRFFPTIAEEGVHIVSVVPTLLQFLNNEYSARKPEAYSTLKHIICGAGPLTVTVAQNFEEKFGIRIIHGYGLSETTCYSCYLPLDISDAEHASWMRDHGYPSIGVALEVNEMDIHDEQGTSVDDGVRGEIVIRGYNVMRGYYANAEANEKAFSYGWFRSGDEGFTLRDESGRRFYFITGRLKELIIRGGVNLAPLEIDEVICRAPGVKAGISVGFENDWYGEEVGAYVQLHEGTTPDASAILAFCRENLPFSKSPKVVLFGNQIPVTSTGKYQRMKVAHLFKEWKTIQFRQVK